MISARKIAHRMVMLFDGKIAADGPPEDILSSKHDRVQRFIQGVADQEDIQRIHEGFD